MPRIFLSPPHLNGAELAKVQDAIDSNWVAPLGPHVDGFEAEFKEVVQVGHAAAVASGTAALHLALRLLDVGPGDTVVCPTLTFVASCNPVLYQGAQPVFLDSEKSSWNLDPNLLEEELEQASASGALPKAVIGVDLYGQSADWDRIVAACDRYDVALIEDAAEALGATYRNRPVGGFGRFGIFSFNGNKIITTSGGGMLVSDDGDAIERARYLASQARKPAPHYEHTEMGFNYRMSNILAALGRAQLAVLDDRVAARRNVFEMYSERLTGLRGLTFMPEAPWGRCTRWLTCILVEEREFGATREDIRLALDARDIEARPVWKPMHLQPVFRGCRVRGGSIAEDVFSRGLCLPSGTALTEDDIDRVCDVISGVRAGG